MSKILLLENIHPTARDYLIKQGFEVDLRKEALSYEELVKTLKNYQALGIRSKTTIEKNLFQDVPHLEVIGAFCIGTNHIDLSSSQKNGVPVFNAPFSNTRSVAEMTLALMISLARQMGTRNLEMHQGIWNKTSDQCIEVRGKTLGIVGYGNIGSQVSMMAEVLGLRVIFYDLVSKLSLGNAKPMTSLQDLLSESDFVTIHVPETPLTKNMIGSEEIAMMKKGSFLINTSRGTVVDHDALKEALLSKKLTGAAVDVYPTEPEKNGKFESVLQGIPNAYLTPHIGGATEEAQKSIGREVAESLARFLKAGCTRGSVNFPFVDLPIHEDSYRFLNVHKNTPGALSEINKVVSNSGANIKTQSLSTLGDVGFLVMDLDQALSREELKKIQALPISIRSKML